jgi:mannose-6-phosphate isomerase-like protein (cupin superfamily)
MMTLAAATTNEGILQEIGDAELPFPGASIGVRVKVYDSKAPDGKISGTPHVHLLCTELYFVLAGSGAVELIDDNGLHIVELNPYDILFFTPGTIHRLINPNRNLELLVVEQGGFPEYGDSVICLPDEFLSDPVRYDRIRMADTVEQAVRRRNMAVEGFNQLRDSFEHNVADGRDSLARFYGRCHERTAHLYPVWEAAIQEGPVAEAQQCLDRLSELKKGSSRNLIATGFRVMSGRSCEGIGYCGYIHKYGAVPKR